MQQGSLHFSAGEFEISFHSRRDLALAAVGLHQRAFVPIALLEEAAQIRIDQGQPMMELVASFCQQ